MGLYPTASSHFHVIEYIEEEQDDECKGVDIYSSKTAAWIYKESKWGPNTCVTIERSEEMRSSEIVHLNSCLHIMGYSGVYPQILVVDMEGETWRKIPYPHGSSPSIHQAQGHLCVCTVHGRNMSKLSIWILEDYGTNKWTLKHTVSTMDVLLETKIEFGYLDVDRYYITVHPEWNLLLFVGVGDENGIVTYNMDSRKVHVIPAIVIRYHRFRVMKEDMSRPYYLPYVPLFSKSLGEQ